MYLNARRRMSGYHHDGHGFFLGGGRMPCVAASLALEKNMMTTSRLRDCDVFAVYPEESRFAVVPTFVRYVQIQIVEALAPAVIMFDVVALTTTHHGRALLYDELSPLLADSRSTKVRCSFERQRIVFRPRVGRRRKEAPRRG